LEVAGRAMTPAKPERPNWTQAQNCLHALEDIMDKQFTATLQRSPNKGGWTYVIMPDSVEFFGTREAAPAGPKR